MHLAQQKLLHWLILVRAAAVTSQTSLKLVEEPCPAHRIIDSFELEGTAKGHLVQPLCSDQGHLQFKQVVQSLVQLDIECLQGHLM